jgi:hypothetical protein
VQRDKQTVDDRKSRRALPQMPVARTSIIDAKKKKPGEAGLQAHSIDLFRRKTYFASFAI